MYFDFVECIFFEILWKFRYMFLLSWMGFILGGILYYVWRIKWDYKGWCEIVVRVYIGIRFIFYLDLRFKFYFSKNVVLLYWEKKVLNSFVENFG